jgi:hypothetical protein
MMLRSSRPDSNTIGPSQSHNDRGSASLGARHAVALENMVSKVLQRKEDFG